MHFTIADGIAILNYIIYMYSVSITWKNTAEAAQNSVRWRMVVESNNILRYDRPNKSFLFLNISICCVISHAIFIQPQGTLKHIMSCIIRNTLGSYFKFVISNIIGYIL